MLSVARRAQKDDGSALSYGAALRNYLLVPLLIGVGFSVGMSLGYAAYDAGKQLVGSLRQGPGQPQ